MNPTDEPNQSSGKPNKTIILTLPPEEGPGDRIGHYKLLQNIGEGGCGVVYMAEQEEPVRRRVALKVIKLGMDTKQVIARFEAERQALAMMDHPNIARVLDAGATDKGRPFFVMELVRGIKITEYCDQNKLSTRERLGLFVQVCNAIQHAHQKGIIHRDIKPSNILVTLHDGVPVPKVIDFGIAKATQGRLTDQTLFTAFEQFIGTPAYMSPEQAEMSGLDIDTRSDIYALGVLLYELLTGRTPFDPKELLKGGLDELRKTIREKEPERPSTRLSTMLNADLTEVAQRRHAEAPKLVHLIRGDLDWIVMKALEKDRTRRYETANGFAMDIQRHLGNEPVIARPPSTVYKFQKLVRRNKTAFAAAGIVVAALLFSTIFCLFLLAKERRAYRRLEISEREQVRMRQQAEEGAAWSAKISHASLLLMRDRVEESEQIISEVPPHASMVALFNYFGLYHARRAEWYSAISNYQKVVLVAPTDPAGYFSLGPLLVQMGEIPSYQHLCELMLKQFGDTTDPQIAGDAAGLCLTVPPSPGNFAAINKLIETALAAGPKHPWRDEFEFDKAFADYREGHFADALQRLDRLSGAAKNFASENATWAVTMEALRAMTQFQLQHTGDAQTTLSNSLMLAEAKLPKAHKESLGEEWNQWIIAHALLREARALMPDVVTATEAEQAAKGPAWQGAFRKAGVNFTTEQQDDGTWELILDDQVVSDLSPLRGVNLSRLSAMHTQVADLNPLRDMRLKWLRLAGTKVADLSPLQGMPLETLQLSGTAVTDLSPLSGMPLKMLNMTSCTGITNLAPLAEIKTFQSVILPPNAKNFGFLRNQPNLVRLGFRYDPAFKGPDKTAAEFWAEYDKTAGK